jgi:hypothetical protein
MGTPDGLSHNSILSKISLILQGTYTAGVVFALDGGL